MTGMMDWLAKTLFGQVEFPENEEYLEFQYKFVILLQVFAGITSTVFVGLAEIGVFPRFHQLQMHVIFSHAILMGAAWLLLRGRKHLLVPITWFTVLITLPDILLYFVLVDNDDVRVLWFLAYIPGVYLLLGHIAGAVITLICIFGIILANSYAALPMAPNSVATTVMSMLFFALLHHAYAKRSAYLFVRLQDSNGRLREMATRDMLTDALNAHTFYEICDSQIQVAKRQRSTYSVLFIDIDHFKLINDTYGHAVGDLVLKSVARCLSGSLRASDAFGRVGGEEFSVFLPNTDTDGAIALAESIRHNIETLMPSTGGNTLKVTASIGVAKNSHSEQTMLDVQKLADQAMYRAKAAGRNRVSLLHD
jgi:diguanylate cyclase (GGDEF)-like protein